MSQSTAPRREMVNGRLGLIAEAFAPTDVRSRVNPAGAMFYGRLALRDSGSGEEHVAHPAAAFTVAQIDGVVCSTHAIESQTDGLDPNYKAQETVQVARKAYIWVAITADVVVGDPVHALFGAGSEGKFADAGGQDISAVAKWEKGGLAADGIALLEINLV